MMYLADLITNSNNAQKKSVMFYSTHVVPAPRRILRPQQRWMSMPIK